MLTSLEKTELEKEYASNFCMVCDRDDWKAPIDSEVRECYVEKVVDAVNYFTATEVKLSAGSKEGFVRVQSVGYRMGPAGP